MEILLHSIYLEPITYIDIDFDSYKALERDGVLLLEVEGHTNMCEVRRVPVTIKELALGHIYVVKDEVIALDMRPTWLPGQRVLINIYTREFNDED